MTDAKSLASGCASSPMMITIGAEGAMMNTDELKRKASLATCFKARYGCRLSVDLRETAEKIDTLRDALSGLIDWCDEGCPDGGRYALVEARTAIANRQSTSEAKP